MAKNNNLTDFLTGVADAIRTKKGTTELINPQNFESEILSIETGGGGTSAVLGELNVSSNGTYEAGSTVTLVPGGLYQYKSVLPKEILAELYAATEANGGVLYNIFNSAFSEKDPITQVKIQKINEEYVLVNKSFNEIVNVFYATGSAEISSNSNVFNLNAGWSFNVGSNNINTISTSVARLPQSLDGVPEKFIFLLESAFDTNNEVNVPVDETSTITIENLGSFYKVPSNIGPANKKLTLSSVGGFNEFSSSVSSENDLYAILESIMYRNVIISAPQTDIEGIKYFKVEPSFYIDDPTTGEVVKAAFVYIEDPSKIQVTAGNVEAGCWYFSKGLYFDPTLTWSIVYEKELVDGYNKVTVNVHSQAKLQSKTATSNGVYSPDEGFDGLSQVTVDFALQNKTITANGTYTCDEGYGGLGQINVSTVPNLQDKTVTANGAYRADASYDGLNKVTVNVKPKLQTKTVTANGTYTAGTGYDGLKQVTVNVKPNLQDKTITANGTYTCDEGYDGLNQVTVKMESRTLLNNGKLAVHTVAGTDNLSLDPNKATIEELIVNDGVTGVSKGTEYTSLKRVVLPDTLSTIASGTFSKCANLESIVIPFVGNRAGVTANNEYQYPFGYIFGTSSYTGGTKTNQTYIYIDTNKGGVSQDFYIPSSLRNVIVTGGDILRGAFENCSGLTSITIPGSATSIRYRAFYNCRGLTSINIPNSVTTIEGDAFFNCNSLASITIPDSVTSIKARAFSNCSSLENITIPDSVTSIGVGVFYNTAYLKNESNWQNDVLYSGKHLISARSISGDFAINSGTLTIAGQAFFNRIDLTSISIPDSVTFIGDYAFEFCDKLTSVVITGSTTRIGSGAFKDCKILTSINIPDSATFIESDTFRGCSSLTSITIPENVTGIGGHTFEECSALSNINIPSKVTSIGVYAFYRCSSLVSVTIPDSVTSIGKKAFSKCSMLMSISVDENNQSYKSIDGNLYTKDEATLIQYAMGKTATSFLIPDSVTSIGNSAFEGCSGLTSITIGNGVTSIEEDAFAWSGLTSITIPNSVTSIGDYAFYGCSGLTSVTIGNGVTSIGNFAFKECSGLTSVTIMSTTPPTLGTDVFKNTVITQIIVPAGCGEAYKTARNWSTYADYIIEEGMHRVTLGENVTCSVGGTSYSNQIFDVADQTVIHFEVGQPAGGGVVSSTPDGIFLNGVLVSSDSEPATYDLTVTGNVSVTYSTGDVVGDITYNNCYKIVMN